MSEQMEGRWQTGIISLKDGIAHIYETKEFSDITFQVHGESFPAHKLVLAARNSALARQLFEGNSEFEEIIVDEKSVTKTGFEIFLRFVYTDIIGTTDKKAIIQAYHTALYYGLTALQNRCKDEINSWVITVDEVFILLDAATSVDVLKNRCLQFIKSRAHEVITSPSFAAASLESLSIVLQSGSLKSVSPVERIKQVMKWGMEHYSASDDFSAVRKELYNCCLLGKLEFEKLGLADLQDIVIDYPGLLAPSEVTNFLRFNKKKDTSLLPDWCLSSNEKSI